MVEREHVIDVKELILSYFAVFSHKKPDLKLIKLNASNFGTQSFIDHQKFQAHLVVVLAQPQVGSLGHYQTVRIECFRTCDSGSSWFVLPL